LRYLTTAKSILVARRKLLFVFLLIPIGLLTKFYSGFGHEFVCNNLGGVIYVIFFIVLFSLIFPNAHPIKISLVVLCVTCLIECSQLIQTDILNQFRTYLIFRTLFGSVFNVFDLLYYIIGALLGYTVLKLRYLRNKL